MLQFLLMNRDGSKEKYVELHKNGNRSISSHIYEPWQDFVVTEISDDESGYEFYDTLSIEEAEIFANKWFDMDLWEKIIFIEYYDKIIGSIMYALERYSEYNLHLVKESAGINIKVY